MISDTVAREFWKAFESIADEVREKLQQTPRIAFNEVDRLLQRFGYDFAFDLTTEGDSSVMILSPEGDPNAARAIDALIAECLIPPQNWIILGRRQAKNVADAVAVVRHIYELDLNKITFLYGRVAVFQASDFRAKRYRTGPSLSCLDWS